MNFLFYAMIILMVVMTISNVRKMKSFGNERGFIDVYGKVLDGQDKAREELEEYLNTNQIEYLNAKAMLVKIYDDLRNGLEYREDIEKLNLAPLFTSNGQFSKEMFNKNCDVFIWLSLIYAVNDQQWFAETPFNDGAIALEPGRAFDIARSMGLEEKVAEILKEEGL